jgi:hypothetical protein
MLQFRLNAETKKVGDFKVNQAAVSNHTPPFGRPVWAEIRGTAP